MTAREYLRRPFLLQKEIERKMRRISFLRRQANRLAAALKQDRVQSTPDPTRMQAFLSEAADEEREILRLEDARKQALIDTALVISLLPEEEQTRLMELRYMDGRGWEETISMLAVSESTAYRMHRRALAWLDSLPVIRRAGSEPDEKGMDSFLFSGIMDSDEKQK